MTVTPPTMGRATNIKESGGMVRIEVTTHTGESAHNGGTETWVRVLSNEVQDWPTIESKLDDLQHSLVAGCRHLAYIPRLVTADADHDYPYEEVWIMECGGRRP